MKHALVIQREMLTVFICSYGFHDNPSTDPLLYTADHEGGFEMPVSLTVHLMQLFWQRLTLKCLPNHGSFH
jgi:hypothetical protein